TNAIQLTGDSPDFADFSPQVTPDSKMIVFQRQAATEDHVSLMKVPIDGGKAETLYSSDTSSVFLPRISPDGKKIAYSTFDLKTFERKLQIASLEGYDFGKVEQALEFNLINQFVWSPDSRNLTILTSRGGTPNIWRQPLDGSPATQITDFKTGRIFNFAWAADGKSLILARGNTANDLILIRDSTPGASGDNLTRRNRPPSSQATL
ncbi:MAG: hypothetical protein ACREO5_11810, partial [Candidatus Binatia bacterium]